MSTTDGRDAELEAAMKAYAAHLGERGAIRDQPRPLGATVVRVEAECEACGAPGAKSTCAGCQSVHYCSTECQRRHWKQGGHREVCKQLKAKVAEDGANVVAQLTDESLPMHERVDNLQRLDSSAAYQAAQSAGLHAAILSVLREDAASARERFDKPELTVAGAAGVFNVLFRGQRRLRAPFGRADGSRVAAFISSDPAAWDACLDAAAALVDTTALPSSARVREAGTRALSSARDMVVALNLALAREEVARALFFVPAGASTSAQPELARVRAERTAKAVRKMLVVARRVSKATPEGGAVDPNLLLEGNLNQTVSELAEWVARLGVEGVDVIELQRFTAPQRAMYGAVAAPLGKAFVDYGGKPPADVSNAVLRAGRP